MSTDSLEQIVIKRLIVKEPCDQNHPETDIYHAGGFHEVEQMLIDSTDLQQLINSQVNQTLDRLADKLQPISGNTTARNEERQTLLAAIEEERRKV